MEETLIYDCIIVGAGLSGLKTANNLKNQNLSVLVLEAKNKEGGRTDSIEYNDYRYDLGGQWVGPTQYRINELIKECNQKTFPQQQKGKKILDINGELHKYSSIIPPIGIFSAIECQLIMWRIDFICRSINLNKLSDWNKSKYYDSLNFQQWMDQNIYTENAKKLIQICILAVFSCNPKDISTLFVFTYFKSAGGILKTMEVEGGAQQDRVLGSSHNLSTILSKKLLIPSTLSTTTGNNNKNYNIVGKIKFNKQVYKIEQDYNGYGSSESLVRVTCKDLNTSEDLYYLCKTLVVTVPPNVADTITYVPELPVERRLLTKSMKMGKVIKFIIYYKDCWWRELGFSGEIVSDRDSVSFCYDGSFEDSSKPCIIGFYEGDFATSWSMKSENQRKLEVIEFIYSSFNKDERAKSPTHYVDKDWSLNRFSNGGYGCVIGSNCNYYLNSNSLRNSIGNIHFAGTETATEWAGYMEGALESAERVSNEILSKLIQNYNNNSTSSSSILKKSQQQQQQQQQQQESIGFLNYLIFITLSLFFVLVIIYNLFK